MMMSLFSTICSTETVSAVTPEIPATLYLRNDKKFPITNHDVNEEPWRHETVAQSINWLSSPYLQKEYI